MEPELESADDMSKIGRALYADVWPSWDCLDTDNVVMTNPATVGRCKYNQLAEIDTLAMMTSAESGTTSYWVAVQFAEIDVPVIPALCQALQCQACCCTVGS